MALISGFIVADVIVVSSLPPKSVLLDALLPLPVEDDLNGLKNEVKDIAVEVATAAAEDVDVETSFATKNKSKPRRNH
jgi:hypothetical protein